MMFQRPWKENVEQKETVDISGTNNGERGLGELTRYVEGKMDGGKQLL